MAAKEVLCPCCVDCDACVDSCWNFLFHRRVAKITVSGPKTEDEFRRVIDFIGRVSLFRRLPRAQYPLLARRLKAQKWQTGAIIIEAGEKHTEFTLIASGTAEVLLSLDGEIVQETLRPGDYFGERILDQTLDRNSPARIVAGPGLVTLSITAEEFEDVGLRNLLQFPKRRAIELAHNLPCAGKEQKAQKKTPEQLKFIENAVRANVNLRSMVNLRDELVQKMSAMAERIEVAKGQSVVEQGELGGTFFIVESGSFELVMTEDCQATSGASVNVIASEMRRRLKRKEGFLHMLLRSQDMSPGGTKHGTEICRQKSDGEGESTHLQRNPRMPKRRASTGGTANSSQRELGSRLLGLTKEQKPSPTSLAWRLRRERRPSPVPDSAASTPVSDEGSPSPLPKVLKNRRRCESVNETQIAATSRGRSPEEDINQQARTNRGVLGVRKRGQSFGELALLYNVPRTATAVAREDSVLWAISQVVFRKWMVERQQKRLEETIAVINRVDLLEGLLSEEKRKLAQNFLHQSFRPGDWIVRQGECQNLWYILVSGECAMIKKDDDSESDELLAVLRPISHFGERAILLQKPSEFSIKVTSDQPTQCLVLDSPMFNELVGLLQNDPAFQHAVEDDLLQFAQYKDRGRQGTKLTGVLPRLRAKKKIAFFDEGYYIPPSRTCSQGTNNLRLDPTIEVNLRALDRVTTLGMGAYGVVTLERDPTTGQLFALKTMSKGLIVQSKLQDNVNNERELLTMVDSPFAISLLATCKDAKFVYFLFEPLLGGDLHNHLHREPGEFRKPAVHKFLIAGMCLALDHLHERNIVFRDLKPENILLAKDGYPKLCDFGFAKFVLGRAMTLCGTPEYVAPEVIGHGGYDRMVDWWALGVLTYELICGVTPFADLDEDAPPVVIFCNIKEGIEEVKFPFKTPDAVSFIKGLCKQNPAHRLGIGGQPEVARHHFFKGFNFEALKRLELQAPYKPKIASEGDYSMFDDQDQEPPPFLDYVDDGTGWDDEF